MGVGLVGAFAAREVFVSTMGIVFDINDADEQNQPLREALRSAQRADGSKLMTPLTGMSLMVFFVLACQCMSTLAVVHRESGSWRWPALMFGYQSVLAYACTLVVYQGGRLLGFS
jgi:ferrous iron transport protein B